jgi:2-(1,2-epoxy-1,2-dihydrophenyl)acetyl-CoA isomerase
MADDVLFEKRPDGVAIITLNRPDSLNAMGGQLIPLLIQYAEQCSYDREVRCVVLTGAGRAFCAGGDVKDMGRRPAPPPADGERQAPSAPTGTEPFSGGPGGNGAPARSMISDLDTAVQGLRASQMRTSYVLHTMPKPTIAMVNGHAVGAGFSLALACDLRVASDKAKFGTAFRNVGLSGDFGGSYFLNRLVGMGKTRELYFLAEIFEADEALRLGIVNRVVPHDRLLDETLALASKLAAGPTLTFARMKANLTLAGHADLRTLLDQEALNMRLSGMSNDSREAVRAFIEKREANFTGS